MFPEEMVVTAAQVCEDTKTTVHVKVNPVVCEIDVSSPAEKKEDQPTGAGLKDAPGAWKRSIPHRPPVIQMGKLRLSFPWFLRSNARTGSRGSGPAPISRHLRAQCWGCGDEAAPAPSSSPAGARGEGAGVQGKPTVTPWASVSSFPESGRLAGRAHCCFVHRRLPRA